jgi:hypothetical protein
MFPFLSTRAQAAMLQPATPAGPRIARIYRDMETHESRSGRG